MGLPKMTQQGMTVLSGLVRTMRPKQWTKNAAIFAALIFDAKVFQRGPLLRTLAGFLLMCAVTGAVYIVNDLADVKKDRQHPTKRNRPLASGQLPAPVAVAGAVVLLAVALPLALWLDVYFGLIAASYLVLQIAYTFLLKNYVIVDVLAISAGFVLRVGAGVPLVPADRFSPWLYICTTLLALFLGFGKRRQELVLLQGQARNHRAILGEYSVPFLDEMINVVISAVIVAYSLYTFTAVNVPPNHLMMLTIPFPIYGLFRYLYLIHIRGEVSAPDEVLLKDRPIQLTVLAWGLLSFVLLLGNRLQLWG
jgi:4-hydroxybenzoate polyprenyltransferase